MMMKAFAIVLLLVFATKACDAQKNKQQYEGEWKESRATLYGWESDLFGLEWGSCHFGVLNKNECTGLDIVAPSDVNPGYGVHPFQCGQCLQVRCINKTFYDDHGNFHDRSYHCYPPIGASVVVSITDVAPCRSVCRYLLLL